MVRISQNGNYNLLARSSWFRGVLLLIYDIATLIEVLPFIMFIY